MTAKINEHGPDCESTPFWFWVTGFMRQTAREFKSDVDQLKFTLDTIVFSANVDAKILTIWENIKQVYKLHSEDNE